MSRAASDETTAPDTTVRRYALAAVALGFLAPGLGQVYVARVRWIAYIAAAWVVLALLFHTDLPSTFLGFALVLGSFPALQLASMVHAGVVARRNPTIRRERYHRWYVYAAYAIGFTAMVVAINGGALAWLGEPSIAGQYKPFRVVSASMEPALRRGEYFIVKLAQGATQADLGKAVVVSWADEPGDHVYRLVAVGGQTIAIRDKDVVVDGKVLARTELCVFTPEVGDPDVARAVEAQGGRSYVVGHRGDQRLLADTEETTVPEGSLFVLGDSRDNANDSRVRSATAAQNVSGSALFILWSDDWSRIGRSLAGDAPIARDDSCPAGGAK